MKLAFVQSDTETGFCRPGLVLAIGHAPGQVLAYRKTKLRWTTSERGTTWVYRANPDKIELVKQMLFHGD